MNMNMKQQMRANILQFVVGVIQCPLLFCVVCSWLICLVIIAAELIFNIYCFREKVFYMPYYRRNAFKFKGRKSWFKV